MAYDFKSEEDVKLFLHNLGIEYRFGCYSEKNPEVCHLLGDYLEAVKRDFEKARKVYKANCDDYKFGRSCYKFGAFSLLGKGGLKQDYKIGYDYMNRGCEQGFSDACFHQGLLTISNNEECGVKADITKGLSLLEKACLDNHANACYYLSSMYIKGIKENLKPEQTDSTQTKYRLAKDMEKAFKFALKGCELENIYSCINLSQMYAKGEGVEKNPELAKKYKNMSLEMQGEIMTDKTLKFQEGLS